jgi:hypothetical protein
MRSGLTINLALLGVLLLQPVRADALPDIPRPTGASFEGPEMVSAEEGHTTLRWTLPGHVEEGPPVTFELEQSQRPDFANHSLRYAGSGRAFFVSGLQEGRTYFRVRALRAGAPPGDWSGPLVVDVDYPDPVPVIVLLSVGCLVLLATVAAIALGWHRHRSSASAGSPAAG